MTDDKGKKKDDGRTLEILNDRLLPEKKKK